MRNGVRQKAIAVSCIVLSATFGHATTTVPALQRDEPTVHSQLPPWLLSYATYLGGTGSDKVLAVAADSFGNTYVAGLTQSLDFPVANAVQSMKSGASDAFVAKIAANGASLVYATYLGGNGVDAALGIALDDAGNAFVTGYTGSPDFPVTPDALQPTLHGTAYDAFVARLGADGSLLYSSYLGGSDIDQADAVAVGSNGSAYIAGFTCSADFPTANAFQPQLMGPPIGCFAARDAFVANIQVGAPGLVYSTYLGGSGDDEARAIAIDTKGRASLAGSTTSIDFPLVGIGATSPAGGVDAFITRFGPTGLPDYSTARGGSGDDVGRSIAARGDALHVAGSTRSVDFPIVDAFQSSLHGPEDGFVTKIDLQSEATTSATVAYATFIGGRDEDSANAIAVDRFGNAYISGETRSFNFPTLLPLQAMLHGEADAFVARFHPTGSLSYSTFLGGDNEDVGRAIALGNGFSRATSNMHVGGFTMSTDLATAGVVQPNWHGSYDGFTCKVGGFP